MVLRSSLVLLLSFLLNAGTARSASFSAQKASEDGVEIVRLVDEVKGINVTVVPSIGNRAVEMKVHGKNILYGPEGGLASLRRKPGLNGVPFLAPWANRLDAPGYWADGKYYQLNPRLGNFQADNNGLPIHGLLTASNHWEIVDVSTDNTSAHVTSRLEFWKYPELMAQWPFAQRYEMTYRLEDGALEVKTSVVNLGAEPIPLAIGFHPYYHIPDKPRDEWTVSAPVRQRIVVDSHLIPTGRLESADLPNPLPLKDRVQDTGFTGLERDSNGKARFVIASGNERIEVSFGPKYPVAVLWEPPKRDFICIEPMTTVTDGINLQHEGKYNALQNVAPGATWTESFWIRPEGIY
jgi:aldose 1-epimerase